MSALQVGRSSAVVAVAALGLALFTLVITENLPIGLLPLIAADLDVSLTAVGLLVTGYAAVVVVASVPLTRWVRRIPRRTLLTGLLTVFVAACWLSTIAQNYWLLMAARLVIALVHAVFWAVVTATAAGLFPARVRGKVIAGLFAGPSLAMVAGVPLGTWLGQQAGWRTAFLVVSAVGLLALVTIAAALPNVRPEDNHASTGTSPDARRFRILVVTVALVVTGVFAQYTYVTAFFTQVSGFAEAAVSLVLFAGGAAGAVGNVLSGAVLDRWPRAVLVLSVALQVVVLLGLYAFGPVKVVAVGLQALSGFAMAFMVTALQSRILEVAPGSTEVASAASSAAFNVGIGGGALLGGVLLPLAGVRPVALVGGLVAAVGLLVLSRE
ncbi:MFS transporter [Actinokineospora fastidiosa]|uniref:MFS transporter n=1 Tax=Actinokineospora fastidiosa TaxID=1816 RepID=A0A918LKE0_9PSEU|nr:MFS transporter [Actinokineospora fastidiosa]GGS60177.1 MFS transporter [Actinokineospora fastidiosa]